MELIRRFRKRRHDKLRLWILIAVGVIVPVSVCWTIPNMLADRRTSQRQMEATATQSAIAAFRAEHPAYFALCDSATMQTTLGSIPSSPTVLVLQSGSVSDWQADVPQDLQPPANADPTVIICLSMERSEVLETCSNGSKPDLSLFQPQTGAQDNPNAPRAEAKLTRYVTTAALYNLQTGELIAQDTLYGSDPGYCSNPDGSLTGDRLDATTFQVWLANTIRR